MQPGRKRTRGAPILEETDFTNANQISSDFTNAYIHDFYYDVRSTRLLEQWRRTQYHTVVRLQKAMRKLVTRMKLLWLVDKLRDVVRMRRLR